MADEHIIVRWDGVVRKVRVLHRFKNGEVSVEAYAGRWVGGQAGSSSAPTRVTVEPWQILPDSALELAHGKATDQRQGY